ncbi:TPR repeat protein [Lindgomyces ingoldianus]|uniref:TPR repeat protein n=1 Tax=Lindgomyces ingoldianus TaxID=673940 RepID=A0ACB6R7R1_9PLEO|nr:TPR repeat protein [Lindgomyces ingoldianus]KAF2474350.1 TPR repeat protein [Lindgomyces ingoldianus]
MAQLPRLPREEYTVGWVCALPVELAAAQEMLDEEHADLERDIDDSDENLYSLGSIAGHNVAIVCLPAGRIGNNPAAVVATQMRSTFKGIRFGLMVGIGGGVPSAAADIRLGDVVVSQPEKMFGGVVQYDSGKATASGFERTGSLNAPPQLLLGAVAKVRANEFRGKSKVSEHISKLERNPKFQRSKTGPDVLFDAGYDHEGGQTCDGCRTDRYQDREPRDEEVVSHYGTIASGNQVMKNAAERDSVSAELGGVLCFEMEAAGLMNSFPCLVVRGICDYSDSHKNKRWQPYAAGVAAAYAKEVLLVIPPTDVAKTWTVEEAIQSARKKAIYSIPFLPNRSFVGRKNELDVLKQRLMVDRACYKMSVVGLGGTGKTQVALQFAYTVRENWPDFSVFWVPALSMESFEQACTEVLRLLGMPQATNGKGDAKELLKRHLGSARAGKWLLVVDNADNPDIVFGTGQATGIANYLPQSEEGVTLFTTRTQQIAADLTRGDVLELGPMNRQDAGNFLKKSLTGKDLLCDNTKKETFLDELTYLPLAIAQAAAYLNRTGVSIAKYLQLLQSTEQDLVELMSREFRDDTRYKDSANAVATTWVVSFNHIRVHDAVAADLLQFISCIEWKAIPRSILPSVQSEVRMEDAISMLCGYSFLVRRGNEEEYDVHRLVHLATRIWVTQYSDTRGVAKKATRQLVNVFPSDDYANRTVWRKYLPHALRLLEDNQSYPAEERSELCLLVGRCLRVDGRIREAVRWLEESCKQREELDKRDSKRLLSQHVLAIAYQANGQVKEAVGLLERVVAIQVLAEDHPDRLASQHVLATAYQANGQVKEAVTLLEYVVRMKQSVYRFNHPSRVVSESVLKSWQGAV